MPGACVFVAFLAFLGGYSMVVLGDSVDARLFDWMSGSSASPVPLLTNPKPAREKRDASALAPGLDFLSEFAGKFRLWVMSAPSHTDNYLLMMQKQIQDMEAQGLNCRLAERDTLVVTIVQNAMMEGKIRRSSWEGHSKEESLDSDMVTKLLHYLQIEEPSFSMLVLKKNLKVGERFPYAVRVDAVLEVIDQFPARKLEMKTRKGAPGKCKVIKKRLVKKPGAGAGAGAGPGQGPQRRVFSPQRMGGVTTVGAGPRRQVDKKEAVRSRVQDILSGRSRFVIKKTTTTDGGITAAKPGNGPDGTPNAAKDNQRGTGNSSEKRKGGKHKSTTGVEEAKSLDGGSDNNNNNKKAQEKTNEESKSKKKEKKGKKDRKGKKKGKRGGMTSSEQDAHDKKQGLLKDFLHNFQGKRRLMIVSAARDTESRYVKQNKHNEQFQCDLALRKVSMLSILGSDHNARLRLQHYQLDSETPLEAQSDRTADADLITEMLKEYGLTTKDFSVVVTDLDLKPKRTFKNPSAAVDLSTLIDTFTSRQAEKEREKAGPSVCGANAAQNSLLRFMSKRRLLIISAPSEDDYSFQQQLQALRGQECHMGIRHFALLKLFGSGRTASGNVELFPLNGKSQTEKEPLSQDVVNGLRDQLKLSKDYFSMVVVGKDSDVKAWFPSPMWSLANVYDLVDSMELRQQEERLQRTLGIHCPEGGGGGGDESYDTGGEDGYLYHRPEA
ncbi:coiled-coil domain-containing protein 80 [Engraulis encrasicolus]|uniref:coiled-coil domain-containing protein 80 n=1 Tax=Engraulis encrasicolus TaxID=184585 RepID=UPI002FD42172